MLFLSKEAIQAIENGGDVLILTRQNAGHGHWHIDYKGQVTTPCLVDAAYQVLSLSYLQK